MDVRAVGRIAGAVLVAGALIAVLAHTIHPNPPTAPEELHGYVATTVRAHLLLGSSVLLVCLSLPFLCMRLSQQSGISALIAYPLLFVGLMSGEFLHCPVEIALFPELESLGPGQASRIVAPMFSGASTYARIQSISTPLIVAGVVCLLIATRKSSLPRWPAAFLLAFFVFLVATFLPFVHNVPTGRLFAISLYLAFAGYGAIMITERVSGKVADRMYEPS